MKRAPASARRAAAKPASAPPAREGGAAGGDLARLQSSAGNEAVAGLLRDGGTAGRARHEAIEGELDRPGERLDPGVQAEMELVLGRGLGEVRIHADASAARAAEAANATAFTAGRDVVFGPGAYAPQTPEGRRVLAHELAHVLQGSERGSLGAAPPGSAAERGADAAAAGGGDAAAPVGAGIGRIVERDLTQLDDAALQAEYELAQRWIADHPSGADHDAGVAYIQEIEAMVASRSSAAVSPAPAAPPSQLAGENASRPRNYGTMSDEDLGELARQGDTDAAAEIFARGRSSPGYRPPAPGSEELGPELNPNIEGPPYESGRTPLNEGDIDRYGGFNTTARRGDPMEGHEVLQNAFLRATGQVTRRGTGPVSRGNPSLSVSEDLHKRIDAEQQALGLRDPKRLATMTDEEVIARNAEALERAGVERSQIEMIRRTALDYAAQLRAARGTPPTSGGQQGEQNYTPAQPEQNASIDPSLTPPAQGAAVEPNVTPSVEPNVTPSAEPNVTPSVEPNVTPSVEPNVSSEPLASVEPNVSSEGQLRSGAPVSGEPGVVSGVASNVVVPLILGSVHDAAVEAIRDRRGYAPVGPLAYANEGFFSRLGRIFTGAAVEEQTADLAARFNVTAFRANARQQAAAVAPGGIIRVIYQVPVPREGGREVMNVVATYRKQQDGSWQLLQLPPGSVSQDDLDLDNGLIGLTYPVIAGDTGVVTPPDFNVIVGNASDADVARMLHVVPRRP